MQNDHYIQIQRIKSIIGMAGHIVLGVLFGILTLILCTNTTLYIQNWQKIVSASLSICAFAVACTWAFGRLMSIQYIISFIVYLLIELCLVIMLITENVMIEFVLFGIVIVIITIIFLISTILSVITECCFTCCDQNKYNIQHHDIPQHDAYQHNTYHGYSKMII
jgi:hypothetical protein